MIVKAWPQRTWRLLDDPERLERVLEPREMDVTVLFCDLRGFTRFAEQGKDSLLETWGKLSYALDEMSSTITLDQGIVAGFQGDAVMGFWGWPEPQDRQIERAADAALRIQERLGTGRLKGFKCGLGLAHGRAVAGRLGAHDLAKVDVYGPVVNLASRLEGLTKSFGVGVLVDAVVADHLRAADPSAGRYRLRRLARLRPKGMADTVLASELSPADATAMNAFRQRAWDQAVAWFTDGQWADAYEQLAAHFATNDAAKFLLRHMDRTDKVPPADWAGAITLTTKE